MYFTPLIITVTVIAFIITVLLHFLAKIFMGIRLLMFYASVKDTIHNDNSPCIYDNL